MTDKSKALWVAMVVADVDTADHEEYEWDGHTVATYLQGALNAGIEPGDKADVAVLGRADRLTNPQDLINTWVADLEAADEKPWLETRDLTQVDRMVPWTHSGRNTKRGFATELLVCTDDEHAWFVAACLPGDFRVARLITASGNAMIRAAKRLGVDALDLARRLVDGQIADLIDSHCPVRDGGRIVRLTRVRPEENEAYTDLFFVSQQVEDVEAALRAAVEEFLTTPEGREAVEDTHHDFNWGDAIVYVPDEIWGKHGLKLLGEPNYETVFVDQDERLCPELCPHGEHPTFCNTCRGGYDDPAEAASWETPYEEEATA